MSTIALLILIFAFVQSLRVEFAIHKVTHASTRLGKLFVEVNLDTNIASAYIEPEVQQFITKQDQQGSALLKFTPLHQQNAEEYFTSVGIITFPSYSERIVVVLGSDMHIAAINYFQEQREKISQMSQIDAEVFRTEVRSDELFHYTVLEKSEEKPEEEQSFFQKYKYALIIGGVLLYTMGTADPGRAAAGEAAPATN